ncbi:hypothetical protein Cgig2_014306 [Carnegiea gigantea]|uniref:Uncharacterized protein n=1 Tax=Carnegiea gigantea TaxID=171969 RepID=A0A9Q1GGM3_9CARY|nr:hypothetical protein Cgig2_014306 [Carnegiea gigantea]
MKRNITVKVLKMKALFRDGRATTNLIVTSNRWLAKVMTELEELILGAHSPLKRVRKVANELVSDTLIRDRPKRSNSRTPKTQGLLIHIDTIEKHFMGSRDKFTIPSFSLGVSQEEKKLLPEGVVVVDLHSDSLATAVQVINCDVEDVVTLCMTTSTQRINNCCCWVVLLVVL